MAGRQSAFRTPSELSERLRRIREETIRNGADAFRVVLPGSDRPVPGPSFGTVCDALTFARGAGATTCEVIRYKCDGALLFEVGRNEWLLSWSRLPLPKRRGSTFDRGRNASPVGG